jgi:hypothetical protein
MMRLLLIFILTLLPLSSYSADSALPSEHDTAPKAANAPLTVEQFPSDEAIIEQQWPYANPYHPTSATNFDPFAAPVAPRADMSGSVSSVYGHFGDPLFPGSIKNRDVTDHPFAMDSPANLYGRDQRVGGR